VPQNLSIGFLVFYISPSMGNAFFPALANIFNMMLFENAWGPIKPKKYNTKSYFLNFKPHCSRAPTQKKN